jgi:amidohydrolase
MKIDPRQERILQAVDAAAPTIISVSHQIHDHPELGYQENFAADLLCATIAQFGFTIERGLAEMPTAFCARSAHKSSAAGPRLAILAEYDALPEIGHGCGHNVIATSALGAAIGLGAVVAETGGEVCLVGTPAEETDGGKVRLVQAGFFKDFDAAIMIHPASENYVYTHSLALNSLQVSFYGKTAHASSSPWDGVNALDAVILTFNAVNALRQQIRPDARIHGIITNGGTAPNIIPEFAQARFYLRARQRSYVDLLEEKFKACANAAAQATGTRVEFAPFENSFDEMVNNLPLADRMRDYMVETLGSTPFSEAPETFGSVDMGNVSRVTPAMHVLLEITQGVDVPSHTREFAQAAASPYADEVLIKAGKGMALTGYDFLTQPDFRNAIQADFKRSLG